MNKKILKILEKQDPKVAENIKNELNRQRFGLEMIPSENFTSVAVLEEGRGVSATVISSSPPQMMWTADALKFRYTCDPRFSRRSSNDFFVSMVMNSLPASTLI